MPNPQKANFSAVLFDMDGLLLDTENIALIMFAKVIEEAGFDWSSEIGLQMIGRNAQDADALLSSHYGRNFSTAEIRIAFLKKYQEHLCEKGVPLKSGAVDLLQALQKSCTPCALVTSSRRRLTNLKLDGAGISTYFAVQICGDEIDLGKPNPQGYLQAAAKLNVAAEDCLVLEDSAPGIEAALAAGMTAWWIPDKISPTQALLSRGAIVFDSLKHVQNRLFS